MTKEQLATLLNRRSIGYEISDAEEKQAKRDGLLVIFGASDDLVEFRGVINDEAGAYEGAEILISADGKILEPIDREDSEVLRKHGALESVLEKREAAMHITAIWDGPGAVATWTFETAVPHATFDVIEDEDTFCRGIVIELGSRS